MIPRVCGRHLRYLQINDAQSIDTPSPIGHTLSMTTQHDVAALTDTALATPTSKTRKGTETTPSRFFELDALIADGIAEATEQAAAELPALRQASFQAWRKVRNARQTQSAEASTLALLDAKAIDREISSRVALVSPEAWS